MTAIEGGVNLHLLPGDHGHNTQVSMALSELHKQVASRLRGNGDAAARLEAALEVIADAFGAVTATLHRAEPKARLLHRLACRGIPEKLLAATARIPFGKGMAGLCAERRQPVTVCNLQTDETGTARPAARETGVAGALVVPIFDARSGELAGTLGVGKPGEHDYSPEEHEVLAGCAREIAPVLESAEITARS